MKPILILLKGNVSGKVSDKFEYTKHVHMKISYNTLWKWLTDYLKLLETNNIFENSFIHSIPKACLM